MIHGKERETLPTNPQQQYESWLNDPNIDEQTKEELRHIRGETGEIEDRFYRDLEFGTGGLRGVMGAGTNRMNRYVIGKATQGFANFLLGESDSPAVVIAHDSRSNSDVYSLEAACVLAANGIRTYLFRSLRPTPQLSFAVRDLKATGGIVVTASHNPPEYNGYKVYGADGGQLVPHQAEQVIAHIRDIDSFDKVKRLTQEQAEEQELLCWLSDDDDQRFIDTVAAQTVQPDMLKNGAGDALSVVFTPLHGAGNIPIQRVLAQVGFTKVNVVWEQEQPNSMFPTVKSPNPEEQEAFTLAIKLANEVDADIIVGTDPDSDRMGAVVKNDQGEFVVLSGNQSGALMVTICYRICRCRANYRPMGLLSKRS
jgi:phosphoglucomutase